jgi:hypothetical protein
LKKAWHGEGAEVEELGGAMVAAQAEIVDRRLHGDKAVGGAEAMEGGDTHCKERGDEWWSWRGVVAMQLLR